MRIEITLNGEPRSVEPGCTLADLVDDMGGGRRGVAVAVDGEVVPRSAWAATEVDKGNEVEVLRAAQGG